MNVDQLTAKFAQAYTKRADSYYSNQSLKELSPEQVTELVQVAENRDAYRKVDSSGESNGFNGTPTLVGAGAGVPIGLLLHSILAKDKSLAAYLKSALIGGAAGAGVGYLGGTKFAQSSPSDSKGGFISEPGIPFQVQTGPTGTMSGAPELLARPIETQQSYGGGAFYDPTNAGFWSPFLDVPFVGDDQRGFGTGSTIASGLGAYGLTKGFLNRALLDPRHYFVGSPRAPMYMTPEATDLQLSRSLGVIPGDSNKVEGVANPLSAVQMRPVLGAGKPVTVTTPDPAALRAEMASQGMVGPGVSPGAVAQTAQGVGSNPIYPVRIDATQPGSGKGSKQVTSSATFNPQTPLLRPGSRIPTAAGVRAAVAPTFLGGLPTGPKGDWLGKGKWPMYAGLAGIIAPQIVNAVNAFTAPNDPTGSPFSRFIPRVGHTPAVLGVDPESGRPMIYKNVSGQDVPF